MGRQSYNLNGVENNPTLELVRGHSYTLKISAPSAHPVWIKSALGVGSASAYNLGIVGNGTNTIKWRVDETTPTRLLYQSYSSTEISGSISILSAPPTSPDGITTYADLHQALQFLQESLTYTPQQLAGQGLKLNGNSLALAQEYLQYFQDSQGTIYTTASSFAVDDNLNNLASEPTDLQSWINYLAASLRQIKGGASYQSSSPTCIQLSNRIDNLQLEVKRLLLLLPNDV